MILAPMKETRQLARDFSRTGIRGRSGSDCRKEAVRPG